jgi:hypothetical protein
METLSEGEFAVEEEGAAEVEREAPGLREGAAVLEGV